MKKISLLAVAFLAISFASCKKTHTCTCTDTASAANGNASYSETYTLGKQKEKDAKSSCDSYKTSLGWDDCKLN